MDKECEEIAAPTPTSEDIKRQEYTAFLKEWTKEIRKEPLTTTVARETAVAAIEEWEKHGIKCEEDYQKLSRMLTSFNKACGHWDDCNIRLRKSKEQLNSNSKEYGTTTAMSDSKIWLPLSTEKTMLLRQ